jgi:FkbM family methyltransferase
MLKSLVGIEREVISSDIGCFYADPVSHFGNALLTQGTYEPKMMQTLQTLLCDGATFIDLGANEGYFTVAGAHLVGASGRVVAIEPQPRLQPILERNLKLNNIADRIDLHPVAVSEEDGEAQMFISPDTNTGSSGLARSTRYGLREESVPLRKLSTVFENAEIETADLIKIDVEGFEYEAVMGSLELFAPSRIRAVALELHPDAMRKRGHTPNTLLTALKDRGYERLSDVPTLVMAAP